MESLLIVAIAAVAVFASSLAKMPWFSKRVKVLIATLVSVVGAAVYTFMTGDFETLDLIETSTQVFGLQQLLYLFIIDGSKLDGVLSHVGVKTKFDDDAL